MALRVSTVGRRRSARETTPAGRLQRLEDRNHREKRTGRVRHGRVEVGRRIDAVAIEHACLRELVGIVPCRLLPRPAHTVATERAVHMSRIARAKGREIQAEARHDAGPKRFREHIGRVHEARRSRSSIDSTPRSPSGASSSRRRGSAWSKRRFASGRPRVGPYGRGANHRNLPSQRRARFSAPWSRSDSHRLPDCHSLREEDRCAVASCINMPVKARSNLMAVRARCMPVHSTSDRRQN